MYILNGFLLLVAQINDEQSMYLPLGGGGNIQFSKRNIIIISNSRL